MIYKEYTCPGSGCPNDNEPKIITLTEYDKEVTYMKLGVILKMPIIAKS